MCLLLFFFVSSRRRHTRGALVTGVQTCALPISALIPFRIGVVLPLVLVVGSFTAARSRTPARRSPGCRAACAGAGSPAAATPRPAPACSPAAPAGAAAGSRAGKKGPHPLSHPARVLRRAATRAACCGRSSWGGYPLHQRRARPAHRRPPTP